MPRGRMLNKKISGDEVLAKVSIKAMLLYTWCIPHLDVKGRIIGTPEYLKGTVLTFVEKIKTKEIFGLVSELFEVKLVKVYGEGGRFLEFNGFASNQTVDENRESPSIIPEPTQELLKSYSGLTPAEVKLSKVNINISKDNIPAREKPEPNPLLHKVIKYILDSRLEKLKSKYMFTSKTGAGLKRVCGFYGHAPIMACWDIFLYDYMDDKNRFWRAGYTVDKFVDNQCITICMEHPKHKEYVKRFEKLLGLVAPPIEVYPKKSIYCCDGCVNNHCVSRSNNIRNCPDKIEGLKK